VSLCPSRRSWVTRARSDLATTDQRRPLSRGAPFVFLTPQARPCSQLQGCSHDYPRRWDTWSPCTHVDVCHALPPPPANNNPAVDCPCNPAQCPRVPCITVPPYPCLPACLPALSGSRGPAPRALVHTPIPPMHGVRTTPPCQPRWFVRVLLVRRRRPRLPSRQRHIRPPTPSVARSSPRGLGSPEAREWRAPVGV
jgi:hypothetical protein